MPENPVTYKQEYKLVNFLGRFTHYPKFGFVNPAHHGKHVASVFAFDRSLFYRRVVDEANIVRRRKNFFQTKLQLCLGSASPEQGSKIDPCPSRFSEGDRYAPSLSIRFAKCQ
jgi:hypothetical protein